MSEPLEWTERSENDHHAHRDMAHYVVYYDLRDEEVADDIRKLVPEVITEAIEGWIACTGNLGSVSVQEGKHADQTTTRPTVSEETA
jgi:hypothetical protein